MSSIITQARRRIVQIPGVSAAVVVIFWGGDLAIRTGIDWAQAVWLIVVACIVGLLSLGVLLPVTLLLDKLMHREGVTKWKSAIVYGATFSLIGVGVSVVVAGVISSPAALLAGLSAGLMLAALYDERALPVRRDGN